MTELEITGPYKVGDQILGDLEVTGLLGMGGHAYVYECVDRYMDATIAVKVIPNVPGRGKGLLNRAQAEAKLLFKLNHPNVVRVMTARPVSDQMVCIVMEKLEGLSLRQFLRLHKRFTVTEALLIVRQIAAGVGAAHRLNVIHRDIKPENVFILPPDNQVKVLDFGIAKFLGQGLDTTNKLRVHGTPLYMSPEHLQSSNITYRSDIYELGGLAFELMTGKIPCLVDLENPNFQQMAYVQIMKPTPPLSRLIKDVGPRTELLIKRATAKDPAQRFGSMQEVIAAVDEALIEQKTLYPREAETIRYVNDAMIQEVKLAERRTDEEDEGWEPIHDAPSSPPQNLERQLPPPTAPANPAFVKSKPVVGLEAQQNVPVMAPTVELSRESQPQEQPSPARNIQTGTGITAGASSRSRPASTEFVAFQPQPVRNQRYLFLGIHEESSVVPSAPAHRGTHHPRRLCDRSGRLMVGHSEEQSQKARHSTSTCDTDATNDRTDHAGEHNRRSRRGERDSSSYSGSPTRLNVDSRPLIFGCPSEHPPHSLETQTTPGEGGA